jgi:transposase
MLNGMLWLLRAGAPWRDLPAKFGPWPTVYVRFAAWRRDGVLDEVVARLQEVLNDTGKIDWALWCIDGSSVRAARAAAGAASKRGMKTNRKTLRSAGLVGASARRSTL